MPAALYIGHVARFIAWLLMPVEYIAVWRDKASLLPVVELAVHQGHPLFVSSVMSRMHLVSQPLYLQAIDSYWWAAPSQCTQHSSGCDCGITYLTAGVHSLACTFSSQLQAYCGHQDVCALWVDVGVPHV